MHIMFPADVAERRHRCNDAPVNPSFRKGCIALVTGAVLVVGTLNVRADPASNAPAGDLQKFANMSLEQLMQEPVTSVSRREQTVAHAAAAVFIITPEDIERSGALSIPEVLRIVPGLSVGQIDASKWAISARGFQDELANKLLVMVDGRTVYDPLFSGVWWDSTDYVLEDIERIEVIRGPGGSVWGANAVNGVINIITKSARDTQGGLVTGVGGNQEAEGSIRYGGTINQDAAYRVYVKYSDHDANVYANGARADDDRRMLRTGFRTDWSPWDKNLLTVSGDYYDGVAGFVFSRPVLHPPWMIVTPEERRLAGGNVLARWTHTVSYTADVSLQAYYDRLERHSGDLTELRDTADVELQNHFKLGDRNEVVWGANYRAIIEETHGSFFSRMIPDNYTYDLYGVFLQDEYWLVPDRLRLTAGTKLEHNEFSGWEIQPNGRLLWTPDEHNSIWASVSRAVHTPDRISRDLSAHTAAVPLPTGGAVLVALEPHEAVDAERVMAYELGYRVQPTKRVFFDIAAFYNEYRGVIVPRDVEPQFQGDILISEFAWDNALNGRTYGVELAPTWKVTDDWQLSASYAFIEMDLNSGHSTQAGKPIDLNHRSPEQQFNIRSHLELPAHFSFDTTLYYADQVNTLLGPVRGYVRLDTRVAYHPCPRFEAAVGVMNILDDRHPEYTSQETRNTQIERSFYGKVTWRF